MTYKTILGAVALSLVTACATQIVNIEVDVDDGDDEAASTMEPGTSSFGPDWQPTTSGGSTDPADPLGSTTGSTGGEDSSTGDSDADSSSSTGSGLPVDDPCQFGRTCDEGACAPNGECVDACDSDGRCGNNELCLAGACVWVAPDMAEAQLVAFNDSPVGAVSSSDTDVWKVALPYPGSFEVKVNGSPVPAYVLSGMGNVISTPADAVAAGDFLSYPIQIDDVTLPIAVILMSPSTDQVPYFFYMTAL